MIIRDALLKDEPQIYGIIAENWSHDIAEKACAEFDEMFPIFSKTQSPPHYYVAEMHGKVVGCGGFRRSWLLSNTYEFVWINVKKEYQGHGVGEQLTKYRIKEVTKLGGNLILLMTKKWTFFKQYGFKVIQSYENGWRLMSLQLRPVKLDGEIESKEEHETQ